MLREGGQEAAGFMGDTFGTMVLLVHSNCTNLESKLMCTTPPPPADLHYRDPGDAAGPWAPEAAELWYAHGGAVPSQHGDARGTGGRRGLRGDPGRHPRGVLQVRQRPLH